MERTAPPDDWKLSTLVQRTPALACSDPRDEIYGLIGFMIIRTPHRASRPHIKIGYQGSVVSCIRNAVRAMFRQDGNLLNIVDERPWVISLPNDELARWASRVPRFDKPRGYLEQYPHTYELDGHSADGGRQSILHDREAGNLDALFVSGLCIGTVTSVFAQFRESIGHVIFDLTSRFENALLPHAGFHFLKTISADHLPTCLEPGTDEFIAFWLAFQESSRISFQDSVDWTEQDLSDELEEYWHNVDKYCRNRRLLKDGNGHLGLGPSTTEEGDIISILFGAPWLIVLRPQGTWYEFIQPCYMSGIMKGEAVRTWETKGEEAEIFEIR